MNKLTNILIVSIVLLIFVQFVVASNTSFVFKDELTKLKETGDLTEISSNIDSLTDEQKAEVITEIDNSPKFWEQWNELNLDNKKALWRNLNQVQKDSFMGKYGEYLGLPKDSIKGFNENMGLGEGGIIGNEGIFLRGEDIKKYNANADDKIVSIEYKSEGEKGTLVITKESGASAKVIAKEIPGKKDAKGGYYFNAETGKFYRLGKDKDGKFALDKDDPLSGTWNGKGHITLDASEQETKISLDYNNEDDENYAEFVTSNKDIYTVFQNPSGEQDADGNEIYNLNKAEITFDKDGKVKSLSNVYKSWEGEGKKWGGFFGENVNVLNSKEEFDKLSTEEVKALGSYLVVDEEKGFIQGDVKRDIPTGLAPGSARYADALRDFIAGERKVLEAAETLVNAGAGIDDIKDLFKGREKSKSILRATGLSALRASLDYAEEQLSIAENMAAGIGEGNLPLLRTLTPAKGANLDLILSEGMAATDNLNEVKLNGGSLSIQEGSTGRVIPIVKSAITNHYNILGNLNDNNPQFKEAIDFYLTNEKQVLNVFNTEDNRLDIKGANSLENLKSVKGDYVLSVSAGITTGRRGVWRGGGGSVSVDYQVNEDTIKEANKYWNEEIKKYNSEYDKLWNSGEEGHTSEEIKRLTEMRGEIDKKYYSILNKRDSVISIESSLMAGQGDKVQEAIENVANNLRKGSNNIQSDFNNPDLNVVGSILIDNFGKDKEFQNQLIQRGITNIDKLKEASSKELEGIAKFLGFNSGTKIELIKDSTNNFYQLRSGGNTYNLDPVIAPVVAEILPLIIDRGGVTSEGSFYLDKDHSRFGNSVDVVFYGGQWRNLAALKSKNAIQESMTTRVKSELPGIVMDPTRLKN